MKNKLLVIAAICLVFIACFVSGCGKDDNSSAESDAADDALTGNTVKDVGAVGCKSDESCVGDQTCINKTCTDPKCAECSYLDQATHTCKDYECCDAKGCGSTEKCSYNKCVALECDKCTYAENHECVPYKCCDDSDCDDDNSKTEDTCESPKTAAAKCTHETTGECGTDLSCFTSALENCDESNATISLTSEDDDYEWDYELRLEVVGEDENDENACEMIMEVISVSVDFTDAYYGELEDEGKTEDEIQEMIDDKNDDVSDYEGDDESCSINEDSLEDVTAVLNSWSDDDTFTMDEFNCDALTS